LVGADENADVWKLRENTGKITGNERALILNKKDEITDEKKLAAFIYVKAWKHEVDHMQITHRSASFFSAL
jgi:hypothetical protein